MKTPTATASYFAIRFSLFAISLCGCSGSARINFISLNTNAIDPPRTEPWRFNAQECYWWLDETGEFNLAMQCRKANLFLGRLGDVEIDLSFALDGPPAGSGRDYPLRQREVRAAILSPAGNQRFNIHTGVCSVITGKDGTYRGSYRVWMTPIAEVNILSILPQRPGPILCFGTFHAVRNPERGSEIRAKSESFGAVRPPRKPPPSTQPAATPASADLAK
ncbi:MAG TPA: hypothetical protein VJZ71_03050 [Phycisphaerae bacterium]|nr:hypothetical protein [Phycisphaerae bacterium]